MIPNIWPTIREFEILVWSAALYAEPYRCLKMTLTLVAICCWYPSEKFAAVWVECKFSYEPRSTDGCVLRSQPRQSRTLCGRSSVQRQRPPTMRVNCGLHRLPQPSLKSASSRRAPPREARDSRSQQRISEAAFSRKEFSTSAPSAASAGYKYTGILIKTENFHRTHQNSFMHSGRRAVRRCILWICGSCELARSDTIADKTFAPARMVFSCGVSKASLRLVHGERRKPACLVCQGSLILLVFLDRHAPTGRAQSLSLLGPCLYRKRRQREPGQAG